MKHNLLLIALFFSLSTMAQRYEKQWERVINLENDGLIKQASASADSIYARAKKDRNEPQIIKAFFFRSKYTQTLDQDAQVKIVNVLRSEIKTATIPTRAILESLYAEILSEIYRSNNYSIDKRTPVEGPSGSDLTLWTGINYRDEIAGAFSRSLENREVLYKKPLKDYEAVINFNLVLAQTNRSLYDFLAERYMSINPYYDEYVDNLALQPQLTLLFGDSEAFSKFKTPDSLPKLFISRINLCREMEQFYSSKKDNYALQRAVLRRLEYLDTKVGAQSKNKIEIATLQQLTQKWDKSPFAYRAMLQQATILRADADKVTAPENLKKALALYDVIIANAALNDAAPEAINGRNDITYAKINLQTEKYIAPNSPILGQVRFKNTDAVTIKIYKLNYSQVAPARNKIDYKKYTDSLKPFLTKVYALPSKKDFYEYSTEIVIPPLGNGFYLISAVAAGDKTQDETNYNLDVFQVTNTTVTEQQEGDKKQYQVSNRATGEPLKNARAIVDNLTYKADKYGRINIPAYGNNAQKKVLILQEADTLNAYFYAYKNYGNSNEEHEEFTASTNLYLDRAIYRPGQTVYFKGIVTQHKNGIYSTVPNTYFTITIEDTDREELKNFRLKTNDYGSFTGEYTLPANVLTGDFRIMVSEDDDAEDDDLFWDEVDFNEDELNFKVEEYKRPTFEVTFNPVTNDVRLNEKITISGNAKSFSGATISNAKVVYRVTRSSRMSRYFYYGNNNEKQITTGEGTTDATGKFNIEFTAEPDHEFDRKGLPVFTYTVHATVTDANGETHDSSKDVYSGYHSLVLSAEIPQVVNADKGTAITITSKNLNNEVRPAQGEITIYKVAEENNIKAARPWPEPEIQTIPEPEFEKLFPYLPYRIVSKDTVIRLNTVFRQKVNTANVKKVALSDFKNWSTGSYQVVFTAKDSLDNPVEGTALFTLSRDSDTQLSGNKLLVHEIKNENFIKDKHVALQLRSPLPLLYLNVTAHNQNKKLYEEAVTLKNGRMLLKIPVSKKTGEVITVTLDYIWQNQYFTETLPVTIAQKKQGLQIESQTITNKLLPGSSQSWSFIIKDSNKTPAEVLASMYDASLDQFATEYWQNLDADRGRYNRYSTPYKNMLTSGLNYASFDNRKPLVNVPFTEDHLYTFGFGINRKGTKYWAQTPKMQLPGSRPYKITGVVTDSAGMPIPGVTVTIQGTTEGTQTDFDGAYTIYTSKGDKLVYSFIGMNSQIINPGQYGVIDLKMEDSATLMENVVVEAYRTTTRAQTSAAVTTVTSKTIEGRANANFVQTLQGQVAGLNMETGSGQPGQGTGIILRGYGSVNGSVQPLYIIDGVPLTENEFRNLNPNDITEVSVLKDASATAIYGSRGANGVIIIKTKTGEEELKALQQVQARKNFNETAFFYPQLTTDKQGKIAFTFTTPESLTEWKLRLLAHNKKGASGYLENTFVTQKDLMVVPNMPRFLREKDTVVIMAKITNMTAEAKTGSALLQLFDAVTMQPADTQMLNVQNMKPFTIPAKGSTTVSWKITVPTGMQGVQYKVLAKAGDFTDGEENILPVLTNSMLVTETLPVWVKPNTTKTYTFENFKNSTSTTLRNQGITLEYTSNPAWVALQALPYLMEYEHDCAEQVFSRFYANAIAAHIVNSNPKIAEVFAAWKASGKTLSRLEQNEELKSIIIAETPWLRDAETEAERKNRLSLLFEMDKMKSALDINFDMLKQKQLPSGGFAWFGGTDANDYITRHILAGFGHLNTLGITPEGRSKTDAITKNAVTYMDSSFLQDYKRWTSVKKNRSATIAPLNSDLHYLYTRSFYLKQYPLGDTLKATIKKYTNSAKDKWLTYSLYDKGMAALALHRFGDTITAKKIIASLKDSSATNNENGMFWIENKPGWYWYRAPIETQALLIEAFTEITNDVASADAMKVWLIKQKQNKNWPTTKSTSEAVYALLMQGSNWLSVKENTTITLGDEKLLAQKIAESGPEAGTGYLKLNWKPDEVTKSMATLTVENKSAVPGFGGFYWQYFEDLDKIKPAQESIMNVSKELYLKTNTSGGAQLQKITSAKPLKIGDLVTIRLILNIKEDAEFVHLKDLRAAGFEPVDVLSKYEYIDGLGYYRSTRDVATHFFFDSIARGTYVLEYNVCVNNAGEFSNGITTIQSMYAPEFSGHTAGARVKMGE